MSKARILIVEDEVIIAMQIESSLRSLGYEVVAVVNSGDKAIAKAEQEQPDLILMDIRIQGDKDGIDTAEIIRNRFGIPVVFSTAYLDEEKISRAKLTMPFGYVLKPIQGRDLKVTLEMALYVAEADTDRRKLELAMKEYEKAVEGSQDIVVTIDETYRYRMVNKAFLEYNHVEKESVIGKTVADVLGKSVFESTMSDSINQALQGETVQNEITRDYAALGRRYLQATYYPVKVENENRVTAILRDITSQKDVENTLMTEREKFKTLFEKAPISYQSLDENGHLLDVNQEWLDALGYTREEVIGRFFGDFIDPEWAVHFKKNFPQFRKMGEILGVEFLMVRKDGTRVFVSFNGRISYHENGSFKQTHCVFKDVSAEKKAKQNLRDREEQFRLLVENIDDLLVCELDAKGRYTYLNDEYMNVLGYDPKELIGEEAAAQLHPDDLAASQAKYSELIDTRKPRKDIWRFRHKNGNWLRFGCNSQTYTKQNGEMRVMVISKRQDKATD